MEGRIGNQRDKNLYLFSSELGVAVDPLDSVDVDFRGAAEQRVGFVPGSVGTTAELVAPPEQPAPKRGELALLRRHVRIRHRRDPEGP